MIKFLVFAFLFCFVAGFVGAQNLPQYNLTQVIGLTNATAGVNSYFTLQLVDASGKTTTYCPGTNPFTINVVGKVPGTGNVAVCQSGRYRASWTSVASGQYQITVSTPTVTLGPYTQYNLPGPIDPPQCTASGNTAGGVAGQSFTFTITSRDQYGNLNTVCTPGVWSVSLSSGGTTVRGSVSSTCPAPGQYKVTYAPTQKGIYSMVVSASGYNIKGSPFTVSIIPGPFNAANSVVSGLAPTIAAGQDLDFDVISYDQNKNQITVCYGPETVQWNNTLQLNGKVMNKIVGFGTPNCTQGVYSFHVTETRASPNYMVSVTANGTAVGSKTGLYPLSVEPASEISAANSLASGVGLFNGVAGLPSLINITAQDIYGNLITDCEVTPPQNFEFNLASLYNDSVTCQGTGQTCVEGDFASGYPAVFQGNWYCDVATNYSLTISYAGANFNKTYYPAVRPNILSGPFSTAFGPGTLVAYAGETSVVYVDPYDQYQNPIPSCDNIYFTSDNFSVQVTNNSGAAIQGRFNSCVQTSSGPNISLVYTLTSVYVTDLQVQYNGQNLYPGTFQLDTFPGAPAPGKCHASGPGVNSSVPLSAGSTAIFTVWCTDAYDNLITQCLPRTNWYYNVTMQNAESVYVQGVAYNCDNTGDRAYTSFRYVLTKAGGYDVDYGYLGNSSLDPHTVTVVAGPLDIGNTLAEGEGVERTDIPAGTNTSFTVYARDAYGNPLQTCLNISTTDPSVGLSLDFYPDGSYLYGPWIVPCDPSTGNYNVTVYYNSTLATEYSVDVRYNDKSIYNSPYSPAFVAGPVDANHVVAWGDAKAHSGLRFGIAGETAFFFLNVSDKYNNQVEDCDVFSESDWTLTLNQINGSATVQGYVFACEDSTGVRMANYTATVSGYYTLDIQYRSSGVNGSYTPLIYPGPDVDANALVWGQGVDESHNVVAGVAETLYVTPRDAYNNNITHCAPNVVYTAILTPPPNTTVPVAFTSGQCNPNTFNYAITYTVYLADQWNVHVRGRQNLTNDQANMNVVPNVIYAPHTNASQPQGYTNLIAGETITVNLVVSDLYYNNITDCSYSNNSAWSVYAVPVANKNLKFQGSDIQCNNGVLTSTYSVNAYGLYYVYAQYYTVNAKNSPYNSNFIAGTVDAAHSYAVGLGVNGTHNVAGVQTDFTIYVANKYGIAITDGSLCSQFNLTDWTVTFDETYLWNETVTTAPVLSCNKVTGSFYGKYTPNRARTYSVDIELKGQSIDRVPYQPTVVPAAVYPPYTIVSGLNGTSSDNGTFYLQTQDRFHNNEIYTDKDDFNVTLSPTCTNTSITTRDAGNGLLEVDYSVTEGGVYCVSIYYEDALYRVLDSTIHAIGGTGCNNSCNVQGYCFRNYHPSTADTEYSCSCFQGWTGDDCSVKMSSKYPLSIGAVVGLIIGLGILLFIIGLILGFFVFRFLGRRG